MGLGALDASTLDRHPHKTAHLTAPVLDALRNGEVLQLDFAHADRLMAARTIRNRYRVRRRPIRSIEPRHTSSSEMWTRSPYLTPTDRSVCSLTIHIATRSDNRS